MNKKKPKNRLGHMTVNNRSYGKNLNGTKIYFEGKRPKQLKDDGTITFGKHILEHLQDKFDDDFKLILTKEENSIKKVRRVYHIRISTKLLSGMGSELWDRNRDIKNDIIRHYFAINFPTYFSEIETEIYIPGTLAKTLDRKPLARLSSDDKEALNRFLPDFIAAESTKSVSLLKAKAQIKSLKGLARNLEKEIKADHPESWWQKFIKSNILIIQQGYIATVEKMNVSVGNVKFPDFSLVTHDGYLDILEIKKPSTTLLKEDKSRDNYYWDTEISKGMIQVENYIDNVSRFRDAVRSFIKDKHGIDLQVLKPRGIILAGKSDNFGCQKQKDDFRLLCQSSKNIEVVTYDELLTRLNNYIEVLENFSKKK